MYKIAICDDSYEYRKFLITCITEQYKSKNDFLIYQYDTGESLLKDKSIEFDLLFIDIQLPDLKGNYVAKEIRKVNPEAILVFCSGVFMPSFEDFYVKPFCYLLKQQSKSVLLEDIYAILNQVVLCGKKNYFNVVSDGVYIKLQIQDILYFSIIKRGCEVHYYSDKLTHNILKTKEKISDIEREVKKYYFVSIHKSYLVNLQHIVKIGKNYVTLADGTKLPISRSKRKEFEDTFIDFLKLRCYTIL